MPCRSYPIRSEAIRWGRAAAPSLYRTLRKLRAQKIITHFCNNFIKAKTQKDAEVTWTCRQYERDTKKKNKGGAKRTNERNEKWKREKKELRHNQRPTANAREDATKRQTATSVPTEVMMGLPALDLELHPMFDWLCRCCWWCRCCRCCCPNDLAIGAAFLGPQPGNW